MKKRLFSLVLVLILVWSSCALGDNDVSRAYDEALNDMKQGKYDQAADKLAGISFYLDSVQLARYCRAHAWAGEGRYDDAVAELKKLGSFRDAAQSVGYFSARKAEETAVTADSRAYAAYLYDQDLINGFRDSSDRADTIRKKLYQEGAAAEKAEEWTEAAADFGALGRYQYLDSEVRGYYASGRSMEAGGEEKAVFFAYAVTLFADAGAYRDSAERKEQCLAAAFEKADEMIAAEDFDGAAEIYRALGSYCGKEKTAALQKAREQAAEAARLQRIAEADAMVEEGRFDEAKEIYLENGEPDKASEAMYRKAAYLAQEGQPEEAAALYLEITGWKDSRNRHYLLGMGLAESDPEAASRILLADRDFPGAEDGLYEIALRMSGEENYPLSIGIYGELRGKKDCTLRMMNDLYLYGVRLLRGNRPDDAAGIFDQLAGVGSADLYANMAKYAAADALEADGAYETAAAAFDAIAGYADAEDRAGNCRYLLALQKKADREFEEAAKMFAALGTRADSVEQEKECRYFLAGEYEEKELWEKAITLYEALGDYQESETRLRESRRGLGRKQLENGEAEAAYRSFAAAEDSEGMLKSAFAAGEQATARMALQEALKWYRLAVDLPETEERTAMIARSLLNMEEDALSEEYASVSEGYAPSQEVLYALALRSAERRDEDAALRQMKKAGDRADASERFREMLSARVEALISEEKYEDAALLCSAYGEQERADGILQMKAQREEEIRAAEEAERKAALEAEREKNKARADEAAALLADGKYDEAIAVYEELNDREMVCEAVYQKAAALGLPDLYMQIPEYKDSRELHYAAGMAVLESDPEKAFRILGDDIGWADVYSVLYDLADRQSAAGNYMLSAAVFEKLGAHPLNPEDLRPDCLMRSREDLYRYGIGLKEQGDFETAAAVFDRLSDIESARTHSSESWYEIAAALEESGKFAEAAVAFGALGDYSDAGERADRNRFSEAVRQMDNGMLEAAEAAFADLGEYGNAAEMVKECRYRAAGILLDTGEYEEAEKAFAALAEYSDAAERRMECVYRIAGKDLEAERYDEALSAYSGIAGYQDTAEKIRICRSAIGDRLIGEAETFLRNGETPRAAEAYQAAWSEYSQTDDTEKADSLAMLAAGCSQAAGDFSTALDWYRKAGRSGGVRIMEIAEYAFLTEQYVPAEALMLELDSIQGREYLYRMAEIMLAAGDEDAAVRLFEEAGDCQDAKTRHDEILYQRGLALMESGNYLDAMEKLDMVPAYKDAAEKKQEALWTLALDPDVDRNADPDTMSDIRTAREAVLNEMANESRYDEAIDALGKLDASAEVTTLINKMKYSKAVYLEENGDYDGAVSVFRDLGRYGDAETRAKEARYRQGMALKDAKKYDKAVEALQMIPNYRDAAFQTSECIYLKAMDLKNAKKYDKAIETLQRILSFKDAGTQITECTYLNAKNLAAKGDQKKAISVFRTILDYKDVRSILKSGESVKKGMKEWRKGLKAGSHVHLGKNDLEWVILETDGKYALLISKDVLEKLPFNSGYGSLWRTSTLRSYLNGTFMTSTLTAEEIKAIKKTKLANKGDMDTKDDVFVLDQSQVKKYKKILNKNKVTMTSWTRSKGGYYYYSVITVTSEGLFANASSTATYIGVRPALWIKVSALYH